MIFEHHGQCCDLFSMKFPWGFFIPWSSGHSKKWLASVSQVDSVKLRMGIAIPYVPSSGTSDTAGTVVCVASMNQRIAVDGKLRQLRLVFHIWIPRPIRFSLIHPKVIGQISEPSTVSDVAVCGWGQDRNFPDSQRCSLYVIIQGS